LPQDIFFLAQEFFLGTKSFPYGKKKMSGHCYHENIILASEIISVVSVVTVSLAREDFVMLVPVWFGVISVRLH